jgi:hypothetical protein
MATSPRGCLNGMLLVAFLFILPVMTLAVAQDDAGDQEGAITAVKRLRGIVKRDNNRPDGPVVEVSLQTLNGLVIRDEDLSPLRHLFSWIPRFRVTD